MFRFSRYRKQARLQWLQDPIKINGNNLSKIRRETSRQFRNKRKKYMNENTDELSMNNEIKKIYRTI
jgi:hypothetical protein